MVAAAPSPQRMAMAPPAASSRGRLHRQIYIVIACALGLFVTSTFILSTYIPSPTEFHGHDNNNAAYHSVAHIVHRHQLHGHHFVEPKVHLRRKNDMRYAREEIITTESSKSAHEDDNREEDDSNDDGDKSDNNDDNKEADDEAGDQGEVPHYIIENDDKDRQGNSESESGDAEVQREGSSSDNDDNEGVENEMQGDGSSSDNDDNEQTENALQEGGSSSDKDDDDKTELQEEAASSDKDDNERIEISPRQKMQSQDEVQAEDEHQSQTITDTTDEKKEPPQIFHILETRFMQNQPDLVELAKARLQLFEAICLPTVLQQTVWGNFLWIIRTDPDLHVDIRRELVEMLNERGALTTKRNDTDGTGERALTYVIGSNDNYIVANSTTVNPQIRPFDIHDMFSNMLSKPDKIFAGNVEHVKSTLDGLSSEAKDVVLWTRLDADDGLSVDFLKYIQDQMIRYFVPDKAKDVVIANKDKKEDEEEEDKTDFRAGDSEDEENDGVTSEQVDNEGGEENDDESKTVKSPPYSPPHWMYWCGGQNIDWFLTDPIHDSTHDTGVVYPVLHESVCVTPGITVSIRGDIAPALVPRLDHDKIVSYLDEAGGKACNRTGVQDDDEVPDDGSCFQMIHGWAHAVRSRTPTSAGMMGVNPDENQLKMVLHNKGIKKIMWREMHKHFLLKDDDLRKTNSYFAKHVYDIAEENARGQCTNGHSCKTSSKDRLQQYVDLRGEADGGEDVVDGIIIRPS
mmetsp:Transcript_27704/g.47063  ORF Transcript_27704/g.47063 Transcript_27704/m.47063 type:complete len:742 (-) Transcript_27704:1275-3500(-)